MQTYINGNAYKKLYFRKNRGETDQKIVSGYNIVLDDSNRGHAQISLYGKSVQNTVPGNQLLDLSDAVGGTSNGITVTVNDDGSCSYVGTAIDETINVWLLGGYTGTTTALFTLSAGNYYVKDVVLFSYNGTTVKQYAYYFELTEDTPITGVRARSAVTGITYNETIYPMLNSGTEPLPWEPYVGGISSPNPSYPQEIRNAGDDGSIGVTVVGKNLLEITSTSKTIQGITYTVNEDGSITANGTATTNSNYYVNKTFKCYAGKEYLLSGCPSGGSYGGTYQMQVVSEDHTAALANDTGKGKVFSVDEDTTVHVRITIVSGNTLSNLNFHPMICYADVVDTNFEPYKGATLTVQTPNGLPAVPVEDASLATYTDEDGQMWCADYIDAERGVRVQRIVHGLLPKSGYAHERTEEGRFIELRITASLVSSERLYQSSNGSNATYLMCSHVSNSVSSRIVCANNHCYIRFPFCDAIATVDDALKFVVNNDIEYAGILATPIETPLTDEEIIALNSLRTYDGTTHIFVDSEVEPWMEVEYNALISEAEYVPYKKVFVDGVQVYSAGNPVTYYVDSGTVYMEEVEFETSCLSPSTFTPTKDGWTFCGWREDTTASGDVLTEKVMGDESVTLYAVFKQSVTVSFYETNTSTADEVSSKDRLYNNGNIVNPSFSRTIHEIGSPWTVRGWVSEINEKGKVVYTSGQSFTRDSDINLYSTWQRTVTLTTVANGSSSKHSGTAYVLAGGSNRTNPVFTVSNPTKSGATFKGWSYSASSATVSHSVINALSWGEDVSLYAVFTYSNATHSIGKGWGGDELWIDNYRNGTAFLTGIDMSKYSGATVHFQYTKCIHNFASSSLTMFITGGGARYALAGMAKDEAGNITSQYAYNTASLTFTASSGTTSIGICLDGTGGTGNFYTECTSIVLHGRTVVG